MTEFQTRMRDNPTTRLKSSRGELVTYNPLGVAPNPITTITVIVQPEGTDERDDENGVMHTQRARIICDVADVASPDPYDTFTMGGDTWVVTAIEPSKSHSVFMTEQMDEKFVNSIRHSEGA